MWISGSVWHIQFSYFWWPLNKHLYSLVLKYFSEHTFTLNRRTRSMHQHDNQMSRKLKTNIINVMLLPIIIYWQRLKWRCFSSIQDHCKYLYTGKIVYNTKSNLWRPDFNISSALILDTISVIPEIMHDLVHFTPYDGTYVRTSGRVQVLRTDSSNSDNVSAYQNEHTTPCCMTEMMRTSQIQQPWWNLVSDVGVDEPPLC
jgi:hypothetical protein